MNCFVHSPPIFVQESCNIFVFLASLIEFCLNLIIASQYIITVSITLWLPINLVSHPMILQFSTSHLFHANKKICNPELNADLWNHYVLFWNWHVGFVDFTCQWNPVERLAKHLENIVAVLDVAVLHQQYQPQVNQLLIFLTMVRTINHFIIKLKLGIFFVNINIASKWAISTWFSYHKKSLMYRGSLNSMEICPKNFVHYLNLCVQVEKSRYCEKSY